MLRTRHGTLSYATASGRRWGGERWTLTQESDGSRALRAHCVLDLPSIDQGPHLARDVVQSVDAGFYPRSAYVRLTLDGVATGEGWFRFVADRAECESWTPKEGRIRQTIGEIDPAMRGFGTHALQSDAWLAARFGAENGPGVRMYKGNLMCSDHHFGATGPWFMRTDSGIEYVGAESVEVPAGRFEAHHFRLVGSSTDHPAYDFWTSADGDFLFLKGAVEGPWASVFVLETLEEG